MTRLLVRLIDWILGIKFLEMKPRKRHVGRAYDGLTEDEANCKKL